MGFLWDLMVFYLDFYGMCSKWDFYGFFCGILRDFNGIFMECVPGWPQKWNFYGIFMGLLWDCCGNLRI